MRRARAAAGTLEAMTLVSLAAAAQKWLPMAQWSRALGIAMPVPPSWTGRTVAQLPTVAATPVERLVAGHVRRATKLLPWTPTCLAQASAGQVMLRRRGQPGVVVIGLRPGSVPDERWGAHAWLLGAKGALTGGPAARGFTPTTVFQAVGGMSAADVELSFCDSR